MGMGPLPRDGNETKTVGTEEPVFITSLSDAAWPVAGWVDGFTALLQRLCGEPLSLASGEAGREYA